MAKRAPLICRNGCGTAIWFDWERKFDDFGYTENSTKPNIPLEVSESGEHIAKKHQCPNSEYAKKQQEGKDADRGSVSTRPETVESVGLKAILGNTLDIIAELQSLRKEFNEFRPRFNQLVDTVAAQQSNPLDDDGDSSRETDESPEQ